MAIFNPEDLTFNGEEIKALSEAVFESAFSKPSIELFHGVATGIVVKKQIAILGQLEGMVGLGSGGCDPTSATNQISASQKYWNPEVVSDRLEQCWDTLKETFWAWGLKKGVQKPDLTGTDFFNYIQEVLADAVLEAVFRLVWFGDTTADNVADGGILTNGINPAYFTKIDGAWKQIFAIVAANSARKTSTTLTTRNAAASYALQAFTDQDTTDMVVTKALQKVRFGADLRLRERTDLVYIVTQSVADQYELELINANRAYTTERLENGIMMLKSAGIEVIAFSLWDRIIQNYLNNGTKYSNPHRMLLTTKTNVQVGVEEVANLSEFDVFYDKKSKKNFIDFQFSLDAVVVQNELVQASY